MCYKQLRPIGFGSGRGRGSRKTTMTSGCAFCDGEGGMPVWRDGRCRIVVADEPFAGFCRVIWNAHVREMTDLGTADRDHLMRAVFAVESVLRARLAPVKMNLATLGNLTPHLHWHVIPRFADDSHYPSPVWGTKQRDAVPRALPDDFVRSLAGDLVALLGTPASR